MMVLLTLSTLFLVLPWIASGQFPAICNTPEALQTKICCPDECGGPTRGQCKNITANVAAQSERVDREVLEILEDAPYNEQKGTADARYKWPTVVFEQVCVCNGNYWGVNCNECKFGWTGVNCNARKKAVVRKSFARLSDQEKEVFVNATRDLKNEMNYWSVIVEEPANYSSGTVKLQDVSTYNYFVYLHFYVARDSNCSDVNRNISIDFAHQGPVFPVWHRRYLLTVEREYQRITNNDSFGFPYWQWDENDTSMFTHEYYGTPSNVYGSEAVNVSGRILNPEDWNTICDVLFWTRDRRINCSKSWKPCNPMEYLNKRQPLQRGPWGSPMVYLPNRIEVMIAIAAPSYDSSDINGTYSRKDPRSSFRSRLEGFNMICSAVNCTGGADEINQHMHNNVHNWVGGQMDCVPAAINDPIFNLHHSNVDRILESWIQRFAQGSLNQELLPAYVPASGGHPGHNSDDYIVPFFPLIQAKEQYRAAEEWGYMYDELIQADIHDYDIPNCNVSNIYSCPICDANATCLNCSTAPTNEVTICPLPQSNNLFNPVTGGIRTNTGSEAQSVELGLGIGLGIPLLIAIASVVVLAVYIILVHKKNLTCTVARSTSTEQLEMTTAT